MNDYGELIDGCYALFHMGYGLDDENVLRVQVRLGCCHENLDDENASHWLCVQVCLGCWHENAPCWMSVQAHLGCDADGHGHDRNPPRWASVWHVYSEGCDGLLERHVDGHGHENASHWVNVQVDSENCDGLIDGHDHENAPHWASVHLMCLYDASICAHYHWDEKVLYYVSTQLYLGYDWSNLASCLDFYPSHQSQKGHHGAEWQEGVTTVFREHHLCSSLEGVVVEGLYSSCEDYDSVPSESDMTSFSWRRRRFFFTLELAPPSTCTTPRDEI